MKVLEHMKSLAKTEGLVLILHKVCFLPGNRALGARKEIAKGKTMRLLTFEDIENLKIAEGIGKNML